MPAGLRLDQLAEGECCNQREPAGWKAFKLGQTLPKAAASCTRPCRGLIRHMGLNWWGWAIATSTSWSSPKVCGPTVYWVTPYVSPFARASFDWINCTDVIEHVLSPEQLLREAARVLRCTLVPHSVLIQGTGHAAARRRLLVTEAGQGSPFGEGRTDEPADGPAAVVGVDGIHTFCGGSKSGRLPGTILSASCQKSGWSNGDVCGLGSVELRTGKRSS